MTEEKPVESRFREYVNFARKHKIATVVIVIWLVAPTLWSVFVTVKGWSIHEIETTIDTQNKEIEKKNADIQRLETQLTPFRTIALGRFTGSEPEALKKLAEQLTLLQSADERKTAEINKLKASVTELIPTFRLLEQRQVREGAMWVTRLVFSSKIGNPFSGFAVAVTFDKTYESAKPYVTGQGIVVTGELKTLEGAEKSRIFRFYGTQLLANNYLVVEFRSKEQIQIISLNLEPKPE